MAANKHSTGAKADKAFERLVKNRVKFGFPQVNTVEEVNDNWHVAYSMPYNVMAEVRADVGLLVNAFGKVPWKYSSNV